MSQNKIEARVTVVNQRAAHHTTTFRQTDSPPEGIECCCTTIDLEPPPEASTAPNLRFGHKPRVSLSFPDRNTDRLSRSSECIGGEFRYGPSSNAPIPSVPYPFSMSRIVRILTRATIAARLRARTYAAMAPSDQRKGAAVTSSPAEPAETQRALAEPIDQELGSAPPFSSPKLAELRRHRVGARRRAPQWQASATAGDEMYASIDTFDPTGALQRQSWTDQYQNESHEALRA